MIVLRRSATLGLLLVAGGVVQGCLGSVVGALVAPETVVYGAASSLVNQGATALGGATQAATTAADIDRMLAAHPEAVNSGELASLRDELAQRAMPPASRTQTTAPPSSEFERRGIVKQREGSALVVKQAVINDLSAPTIRGEKEPFAAARTSSIPPAQNQLYQYGWNPDPVPLGARRGVE